MFCRIQVIWLTYQERLAVWISFIRTISYSRAVHHHAELGWLYGPRLVTNVGCGANSETRNSTSSCRGNRLICLHIWRLYKARLTTLYAVYVPDPMSWRINGLYDLVEIMSWRGREHFPSNQNDGNMRLWKHLRIGSCWRLGGLKGSYVLLWHFKNSVPWPQCNYGMCLVWSLQNTDYILQRH
jgi:hypothetical protein